MSGLGGLSAGRGALIEGNVWKGEFRYFFYPVTVKESDEEDSASDAGEQDTIIEEKELENVEAEQDVEETEEKNEEEDSKEGDKDEEEDVSEESDDDEDQNENGECGELTDTAHPFCEITNLGGDDPHLYDLDSHFSAMHEIRTEQSWNSAWIMAITCCKTSISTLLPLHHSFVIFKIQYGHIDYLLDDIDPVVHYMSMEKHLDFIDIQWSDDEQVLINRFHDKDRGPVSVVRQEENLAQVRKVSELVSYLVHDMPALKNTYHLLSRNCQHFIATVYKFCTGTIPEDIISSFIRYIASPIGGPILTFNCPLNLKTPLPLPNFHGERAEVMLSELTTDSSRCIFAMNTGVCATIYSYGNQLTIFLDHKDVSIQLLCPLLGPDGDPLPATVINHNNNTDFVDTADEERSMYCTMANRESITMNSDGILISSFDYKENRSERSLDIFVEQPECGKPNHLFGCTKCRSHVLKTF